MDINPEECYSVNVRGQDGSADDMRRQGKLYFNCHFTVAFHPNNDDKRHYCFLAGWSVEMITR